MVKRTFLFLILIYAVFMLCGCGNTDRKNKAEMLLEKKYGEEFTVTEYLGHEVGSDYYTVNAYADNWPDLPFEASPVLDGSGISDDYVSRRVCRKISDRVAENLSGALPFNFYVHTGIMSGDSVCSDPDVGIEEFATVWEPYNQFYIYILVDSHNLSDAELNNCIMSALSGLSCINGNITVYFADQGTIDFAEKYIKTNTGLYDDYFDFIEHKKKTEYVQYKIENGRTAGTF